MTLITPLIICGGNGTRLWPMSRTQSPKQFQKVDEAEGLTFFQSAVQRHRGEGYDTPVIVSSVRHSQTVAEQLSEIECDAQVILEPMGRNTGPAVLAAAIKIYAQNPDAIMVVVPADHVIDGDLNRTIKAMVEPAKAGHIISFGIKPRYAEIGFGYITDGGPIIGFPGLHKVDRFVEKPPARKARLLVESDIAYWASGLSMFSAQTIIKEYFKFDPETVETVRLAVAEGEQRNTGLVLNAIRFGEARPEPTESMVFEKTDKIALAPLDVNWSDVGSWTAMYGISKADLQGNVLQGDVIAVKSKNSMVRSSSRLVTLVGMSDVIIVDTPDALLVTKVGHCQNVKKVAEYLKTNNRVEVEKHAPIQIFDSKSQQTHVWQMIKTDRVDMIAVEIAPGARFELDAAPNRDVIVVKGSVSLSKTGGLTPVEDGKRVDLNSKSPISLVNDSAETVEVVLTTLLSPKAAETVAAPLRAVVNG
ncbi:MAG: mannose-1-phosphate guanylyltransferase/mannose-6-phosphate isomerase [Paracoccaceae bacterium]|jgi:mannose-1-phosphate guanylyltransferase/mannose-6-phosphate isomerase